MVLIVLRQLEVAGSNQQMAKLVRVLCLSSGSAKSFHEKAGECQVCSFIFSLFFSSFFFLLGSNCSHGVKPPLSPPFHPLSFFELLSLGASWVSSIQQVLLPDNRPRFPLAKETGPGLSRSHLISAVELGSWIDSLFSLFFVLFSFFLPFPVFPREISRQDRLATTI